MIPVDILGALQQERDRQRGTRRCKVQKFLDSVPEDTPHRDELVRLVVTPADEAEDGLSGRAAADVLCRLGASITENPIHDHRAHRCACYR